MLPLRPTVRRIAYALQQGAQPRPCAHHASHDPAAPQGWPQALQGLSARCVLARRLPRASGARSRPSGPLSRREQKAFDGLVAWRWAGEPECPRCGVVNAYLISTQRRFKCSSCLAFFSPLTGTKYAGCKLGPVATLALIRADQETDTPAALKRRTGLQYRSAWRIKNLPATVQAGIPGNSATVAAPQENHHGE